MRLGSLHSCLFVKSTETAGDCTFFKETASLYYVKNRGKCLKLSPLLPHRRHQVSSGYHCLLLHQFRMLSLYVHFRLITCSISTFRQQSPWNKILDCTCKAFCLVMVEVLKIDGRREELSCCCFDKPFTCITNTLLKEITPKKGLYCACIVCAAMGDVLSTALGLL